MKKITLIFIVYSLSLCVRAAPEDKLIQFSGIVISLDSLQPLAFVHIVTKNKNRGTISNMKGYFSFVTEIDDTIIFSTIGYKPALYVIQENFENDPFHLYMSNQHTIIQTLARDTIQLPETVIYPWLNKYFFKEAFIKSKIPRTDMDRAKRNIALILYDISYDNLPMDAAENQRLYFQNEVGKLYYAGQYPTINLLNPAAWMKFFQALSGGKFKRKKYDSEDIPRIED